MIEIIYHESIPTALQPIIKERVATTSLFWPSWCRRLMVTYSDENPLGYTLSCKSEYAYRFVELCIYNEFFNDREWEMSLLHEVLHSVAAPYSTEVYKLLELLDVTPQVKTYIEQTLRAAEEAWAEDTSHFASKLLS